MTDPARDGQCAAVGLPEAAVPPTLSWERVYATHADFVLRCARQMGVPPHHAEDIVHDVFLVVHARLEDFDSDRATMRSWLYGILRRVTSHWRRGRARSSRRLALVPAAPPPASMDDQLARAQALNLLERFIESLDDKKRPVFTLAEVEGMSAPEIAQCLEVKLNTVYSRIRLARKQFARFIEEESRHGSR